MLSQKIEKLEQQNAQILQALAVLMGSAAPIQHTGNAKNTKNAAKLAERAALTQHCKSLPRALYLAHMHTLKSKGLWVD